MVVKTQSSSNNQVHESIKSQNSTIKSSNVKIEYKIEDFYQTFIDRL